MSGSRLPGTKAVLDRLEQECRERGVRLIYDELRGDGGVCRLRDCYYVILNRRASVETRCRLIRSSLDRLAVLRPVPVVSPLTSR